MDNQLPAKIEPIKVTVRRRVDSKNERFAQAYGAGSVVIQQTTCDTFAVDCVMQIMETILDTKG